MDLDKGTPPQAAEQGEAKKGEAKEVSERLRGIPLSVPVALYAEAHATGRAECN
jgi:hypothetical protein